MRVILIVAWLFVGLAGTIYHFGPGKEKTKLDRVDATYQVAQEHLAQKEWAKGVEQLDEVMALLPADQPQRMQELRLEKAKAQMLSKQLPEARDSLDQLFTELSEDANASPELLAQTRSALANSQYYMTWLMRLEGLPKTVWEPEIESARQHYRHLAENCCSYNLPELAEQSGEDLESSIRLARMDLKELQGLPLPSQ